MDFGASLAGLPPTQAQRLSAMKSLLAWLCFGAGRFLDQAVEAEPLANKKNNLQPIPR